MRTTTEGCGAAWLVGNIEFRGRTPQALKIVEAAGLLAEDVNDEAAKIEQRPFGGARSLAMFGRAFELLVQLLFDFVTDGLHLRRTEAGANHEVRSETADLTEIENGDARGFFILRGFD